MLLTAPGWVQVMPSVEVMTRSTVPLPDTATKSLFPYVTEAQPLSTAEFRLVQLMPSGEVMTRLPDPVLDTATKSPFPYVTEFQPLLAADNWLVQ